MMLLALMMVCASVAAWIIAGAAAPERAIVCPSGVRAFLAPSASRPRVSEPLAEYGGIDRLGDRPGAAWRLRCSAPGSVASLPLASIALALAAACGIAAAATNMMVLALAPLIVSVAAMAGVRDA